MEKVLYIRFTQVGEFHKGDLNRLIKTGGTLMEAVFPDTPKGRVKVTLNLDISPRLDVGEEGSTGRSMAFHP